MSETGELGREQTGEFLRPFDREMLFVDSNSWVE
jgi:hypothetical protein